MFTRKKSWLVVMLAVSFLIVVSSVQAVNYFPSGDMENGGDATTPPLYWTAAVNGVTGVSSDTPTGTGQSLRVEAFGDGVTTNSVDYGGGSGTFDGVEQLLLAFDYKGDVYTGGTGGFTGGGVIWENVTTWHHYSAWVTPPAGVGAFSFRIYDNSAGAEAAYIDNVYLGDDYAYQDFGSSNNVYNGDIDTYPDGAYWYGPGLTAPEHISTDTAFPGGTYSFLIAEDSYANVATRNMTGNTQYEVIFWHKGTVDVWVNETDSAAGLTFAGSSEWQMSSFITTTDPGASAGSYMYFSDTVVGGDNVLIDNVTIVEVPEPMTMTLIGLGGLALIRRRK